MYTGPKPVENSRRALVLGAAAPAAAVAPNQAGALTAKDVIERIPKECGR
jgi:hypothetical protein